jgi:prevent-host-death family protein
MQIAQCISVTELAKNTSGIIKRTPRMGVQYVFVNNKPKAVILSMQEYEKIEQERRVTF